MKNREVHLGISQYFHHADPFIQKTSVWAVGELKSQNDKVNKSLVELVDQIGGRIQEKLRQSEKVDLSPEEELLETSLVALSRMDPPRALLQQVIKKRKLDQYPKDRLKSWAKSFL